MIEIACGVDMVITPPPGLGIGGTTAHGTVIADWPNARTTAYRSQSPIGPIASWKKNKSQRSATVLWCDFTIHEDWYMLAIGTA